MVRALNSLLSNADLDQPDILGSLIALGTFLSESRLELFVSVDGFCQAFLPKLEQHLHL